MKTQRIFQLILITLSAIFAVDIVLKILNSRLHDEKPMESGNKTILSAQRETKPYAFFSKIAERNLFKGAGALVQEMGGQEGDPAHPLTNLKLTLKGTILGTKERSYAIIEDGQLGLQNLYHISDTIASGVTLLEIHTDRVVINRNGQKELLLMFQEGGPPLPTPPSPFVRSEPVQPMQGLPPALQPQQIQEAATDLRALMRDIRIIPHFTAGKRDGFTVTYVREGSRLQELGLQKDDIVQQINGTPAEDFRNIFEIFNKFSGQNSLNLGIQRNNQVLTITYTVE